MRLVYTEIPSVTDIPVGHEGSLHREHTSCCLHKGAPTNTSGPLQSTKWPLQGQLPLLPTTLAEPNVKGRRELCLLWDTRLVSYPKSHILYGQAFVNAMSAVGLERAQLGGTDQGSELALLAAPHPLAWW